MTGPRGPYLRLVGSGPSDRRDGEPRVCVRCGWLVLDGDRCARDRGPSIDWRAAARALRVRSLRELLHLEPVDRIAGFLEARDRLRGAAP